MINLSPNAVLRQRADAAACFSAQLQLTEIQHPLIKAVLVIARHHRAQIRVSFVIYLHANLGNLIIQLEEGKLWVYTMPSVLKVSHVLSCFRSSVPLNVRSEPRISRWVEPEQETGL